MITIILEGCDKTGKSTIAKKIHDLLGFKVVSCRQPTGDPYDEYVKKMKAVKESTVFDRWCYGELVYGPLYRGKSQLSPNQLRNLEWLATARNAVLVHCVDTAKNIRQRFIDDKEDFAKLADVSTIIKSYKLVEKRSLLPTYLYKPASDKKTASFILKIVAKHDKRKQTVYQQIIGNQFNPRIILVGNKRNDNQPYKDVAMPFDFGPSSKFLFKSINGWLPATQTAILNSDNPKIKQYLSDHCESIVVALGRAAKKKLDQLGVKCHQLTHPGFESRFHANNSDFKRRLKYAVANNIR